MNIFPYDRIIYKSQLSVDEITQRLYDNVYITNIGFWGLIFKNTDKLFYGNISNQTFMIRQNLKGRNSAQPTIHGAIMSEEVGTRIEIHFRLVYYSIIISIFWFGFMGKLCIDIIIQSIHLKQFNPLYSIAFFVFILVYVWFMYLYKKEVKYSSDCFLNIFEAEIIE